MTAEEMLAKMALQGSSAVDIREVIELLLLRIRALEAKVHRQPFDPKAFVGEVRADIEELDRP